MSAQTKKNSKKNKVSPAENEITSEFFQPQRVKTNRAAKPAKFFGSQEAREAFEASPSFSKDSIPYIDKQIFIENSLDRRDTAPTTVETKADGDEINEQGIEDKGGQEDKSKIIDITTILSDQYIPKKHLFREKESQEILNFIARCVKNDCYETLLLTGPPGTGKTTVLNHVIKKLEERGLSYIGHKRPAEDELEWEDCSGEVAVVNMDTSHSEGLSHLVLEIIRAVEGRLPLSVGGYVNNAKTLTEKLKQLILARKEKKLVVVTLDEIDKMLSKPTLIKEMVELLKVPRYPSSNLIIIASTNIPDLMNKIAEQHKTNLELSQLDFEPYTLPDMLSILQKRFELVGHPDSQDNQFIVNENVFEQVNLDSCVKEMNSLKDTDIRHILKILRKAYSQKIPVQTVIEEDNKTSTPISVSQITDGDIMNAYKEFYDDSLTATLASMSQKHLIGLVSLLTLVAKKGGELFTKKDLLTTYNNICGRLFSPKADLTGLGEILALYEAHNIVAVKQKEKEKDKENEAPAKKSPQKTPMKNEEYTLMVTPDRVKLTLQQDGLFSKYFEE